MILKLRSRLFHPPAPLLEFALSEIEFRKNQVKLSFSCLSLHQSIGARVSMHNFQIWTLIYQMIVSLVILNI